MPLKIETQPIQLNSSITGLDGATFNSISAVSLSGTHFGDGSNLTGILTTPVADTTYAKLSSNAYTFDPSVSSIDTLNVNNIASGIFSGVLGGNCNTASGRYSTVVNGFSSCATGFSTFVGAGSGNRATGDYAVVVGGLGNVNNDIRSFIGGGCSNIIGSNTCGGNVVVGGQNNCVSSGGSSAFNSIVGGRSNTISGGYSVIAGGTSNNIVSGTLCGTIGGGNSNVICGFACNTVIAGGRSNIICSVACASTIAGGCSNCINSNASCSFIGSGRCNTTSGVYTNIVGGLGNFNPLRDSIIGGGIANHTGGFAPFNITAAASISGNGSQTRLTGTGIQSCFSSPFTSGNVSVYYSTPTVPLSTGIFTTATIAATGTNFIVINGDYSTCTASGLSANSIFVYDRAINNTGYGSVVVGGKLNTASGCYSFVGGGFNNQIMCQTTAQSCGNLIVGGYCNCICSSQFANTIVGGHLNCLGGSQRGFIGGGVNNRITGLGNQNVIVAGGGNTISAVYGTIVAGNSNSITNCFVGFIGAGCSNVVSANAALVVGGRANTTSSAYSLIGGGRFNYNPLFNSNIVGGSFNHTGGFTPNNILTTSISGNGTQTALIQAGIGSCFSASNTTGAVSLIWMTSGTAFNNLSSACFTTANVVTNAANCIIINGDYSTCTASGLSACNIWVYDRCLNLGGCTNFIGGGILNTNSSNYGVINGGLRNTVLGLAGTISGGCNNLLDSNATTSTIGGGCTNCICGSGSCNSTIAGGRLNCIIGGNDAFIGGGFSQRANGFSVVVGGRQNNASGLCSSIVGGQSNTSSGLVSFVGTGINNIASGLHSFIGSGNINTASGNYSFVAGGSANDTRGFANTFILGTALSASAANYTYVNNLSSQGVVVANPLRVGNSLAATGPVGTITGKVEIFNATGTSLGFIPLYSSIT